MGAARRGEEAQAVGPRGNAVAIGLAACTFGVVSVLAKLAYREGASPASLLSARLVVAAAVLAALALFARPAPSAPGAAAGLCFGAGAFFEFEALDRLPAPAVAVLVFLAPVWVAAGSLVLFRRRPRRLEVVMIAVALAGIVMLAGVRGPGPLDPLGAGLAVAASLLFAGTFLAVEALVARDGTLVTILSLLLGAALTALVVDPGGALRQLGDGDTVGHAGAIGVLTAVSLLLLAWGLRTTTALAASVATGVEPVIVAGLSWPLLGEVLAPLQLVGAVVALAAATCVSVAGAAARPERPPEPPAPDSARRTIRGGRASRRH